MHIPCSGPSDDTWAENGINLTLLFFKVLYLLLSFVFALPCQPHAGIKGSFSKLLLNCSRKIKLSEDIAARIMHGYWGKAMYAGERMCWLLLAHNMGFMGCTRAPLTRLRLLGARW